MLNVITSFHENMEARVRADGKFYESFKVKTGTMQGCVIVPVLFALFFSIMLEYAFKDYTRGFHFEFRTTGGLFNHQRFKAKPLTRSKMVLDFLFADDAALIATSYEEAQEVVDKFANAAKVF